MRTNLKTISFLLIVELTIIKLHSSRYLVMGSEEKLSNDAGNIATGLYLVRYTGNDSR